MKNMNRIFKGAAIAAMAAAAAASVTGCNCGKNIKGTLSDLTDDSLAVYIYKPDRNMPVLTDTVVAENGSFSVEFEDTAVFVVYLGSLNDRSRNIGPVFMLPGDKIKISGSFSEPVYSGSRIYDGLSAFPEYASMMEKLNAIYEKSETVDESDIIAIQALNAEYEQFMAERDSIFAEYVKANPGNMASGYLVANMNPVKGLEAYNLLDKSVRESAMGEFLDNIAADFESAVEMENNRAKLQPGKPAPDFRLKDINGEEKTLASFRGKYVLLDFWGKWCYWCMKGMPDMKKYYAKYSSRIEFVGINCRDSEDTWKETVKSEGLNWTNLFNGRNDEILKAYAVEGFPTKVLIDPEGNIVQIFVGESRDLYDKLDELF